MATPRYHRGGLVPSAVENPEAAIQITPHVSVVIPVLNEEKDIGNLLSGLLNQTPPAGGFEVLVDFELGDTTHAFA